MLMFTGVILVSSLALEVAESYLPSFVGPKELVLKVTCRRSEAGLILIINKIKMWFSVWRILRMSYRNSRLPKGA